MKPQVPLLVSLGVFFILVEAVRGTRDTAVAGRPAGFLLQGSNCISSCVYTGPWTAQVQRRGASDTEEAGPLWRKGESLLESVHSSLLAPMLLHPTLIFCSYGHDPIFSGDSILL